MDTVTTATYGGTTEDWQKLLDAQANLQAQTYDLRLMFYVLLTVVFIFIAWKVTMWVYRGLILSTFRRYIKWF